MRYARLIPLILTAYALAACQTQDLTAPSHAPSAAVRTSSSAAGKTGVCHINGSGGFQLITVSDNAVSAHLAHGDHLQTTGAFVIPAGSTFTASSNWDGHGSPAEAFDGNTSTEWNAGNYPVQWIEVNFGSPQVISGMTGLIDQVPDGFTNHDVTLDGAAAFSWTGNTTQNQTLSYTFASPQTVQTVRVTTTSSPSWVAWVELQFTAPAGC